MATAYASLVSLINLIEQIQLQHSYWPIFLEKQLREIQSLKEKACLLQCYLEGHSHVLGGSNEAQGLDRRIAYISHAAEDIIESYVVDVIMPMFPGKYIQREKDGARSKTQSKIMSPEQVSEAIQQVIQGMEIITNEMMEITGDLLPNDLTVPVQFNNDLTPVHSLRPQYPTMNDHDTMVGFDDRLNQIMEKLTGQQSDLQIIPITGMGGIGKTTLAQNVYVNPLIVHTFDVRSWITVSQEYNIKEKLLELVHTTRVPIDPKEKNEFHDLGLKLFKHLSGRRYLIIVDDLWNYEAWDKLKMFFPISKGSRIMVTTRLKDVANYVGSNNLHEIDLLDENKSWSILCRKAFGQESCPHPELEKVGKRIAKKCRGLPLTIAVIGGVLVKSKMTQDFWEYVANNIDKVTKSEDSDCLDILKLSYMHLPIHLKPCFLNLGVYPEDHTIRVSELIQLWVAEGFLKPNKLKTLEKVADEYLKDLTERHLIMVNSRGSLGDMKTCRIHDLLRDLCLREAHKERFILVDKMHKLQDSTDIMNGQQRRVVFQQDPSHGPLPHALRSTSLVRSLTYNNPLELSHLPANFKLPAYFKLLRIFNLFIDNYPNGEDVDINLVNLRYLHFTESISRCFSSVNRLWNLQTLIIHQKSSKVHNHLAPAVWKMLHLRHLIGPGFFLPNPPTDCNNGLNNFVLENLQTLTKIVNFRCTEEVLKRIPNVKKLGLRYSSFSQENVSIFCVNNIGRLHKLQSLFWELPFGYLSGERISLENFVLPHLLKKLTLDAWNNYNLEDVIETIGSLPHLEKLKLQRFCTEEEWNPIEGHFLCLRVLKIRGLRHLVYWNADSIHFPVLEHLHLSVMDGLMEIPSGIGDITTLQTIKLCLCTRSVVDSAKNILEEQHNSGNQSFRLRI